MKRSRRLQPVLKIAKLKVMQGAKAMAYMSHKLKQENERLEQLQQYQQEYWQGMVDAGRKGITAQNLKLYSTFTQNVDTAIGHQKNQIVHVENQLQQVRQYWQTLDAKHKGLGKMVDKIKLEELKVEQRFEQREMDELQLRRTRS